MEVKRLLQKAKKGKDWGEFLFELYNERQMAKSRKAFDELSSLLTEKDLDCISESNKKFKEGFVLG